MKNNIYEVVSGLVRADLLARVDFFSNNDVFVELKNHHTLVLSPYGGDKITVIGFDNPIEDVKNVLAVQDISRLPVAWLIASCANGKQKDLSLTKEGYSFMGVYSPNEILGVLYAQ